MNCDRKEKIALQGSSDPIRLLQILQNSFRRRYFLFRRTARLRHKHITPPPLPPYNIIIIISIIITSSVGFLPRRCFMLAAAKNHRPLVNAGSARTRARRGADEGKDQEAMLEDDYDPEFDNNNDVEETRYDDYEDDDDDNDDDDDAVAAAEEKQDQHKSDNRALSSAEMTGNSIASFSPKWAKWCTAEKVISDLSVYCLSPSHFSHSFRYQAVVSN
jgi:hypothetical protein